MPNPTPTTHCPHLRLTHGGFPGHSLQQLLCASASPIKEKSDNANFWAIPEQCPPPLELKADPSSAYFSFPLKHS